MSYDRMGRRVTKNDQRFIYDGYLQIANSELQTLNTKLQTFIWDPTEHVATRPLVWLRGTSAAYYTLDGNKNVSEVVTVDGTLAAHYEYAPFGAVIAQYGASAVANPWRFSSEYAEDDTATVYYNYRHYEPMTGRWMSWDPVGIIKLYQFASNKYSEFDWLGLWPVYSEKYWKKVRDDEVDSEHTGMTHIEYSLIDCTTGDKAWWKHPEYEVQQYSGDQCKNALKVMFDKSKRKYVKKVDVKCPCSTCYKATASFPNIEVHAHFVKEKSWIKASVFEDPDALRRLLAHESTHWAIGATMASNASSMMRKIKKEGNLFCNEGWAKLDARNLLVTEINSEYDKFVSAERAEQKKFDDETRHGVDSDKEAEWEKKYDVH
jgi:RHS repeat-associated protein